MPLAKCCISRIRRNEIFGNKIYYHLDILYKLFLDSVMIESKYTLKWAFLS